MVNMAFRRTPIFLLTLTPLITGISAESKADELPEPTPMNFECDGGILVQTIVDGLQSDWEHGTRPADRVQQLVQGAYRYDWTGPVDASFRMWCRYTDNGLYFAVVGRDNLVVAPDGRDPGDTFEVRFEIDAPTLDEEARQFSVEIPLWDDAPGAVAPHWTADDAREGALHAARAEVASRDNGYFLEFNIPYVADPQLATPFAPIRFVAMHRDWDGDADREELAVISSSPWSEAPENWGTLSFTGTAHNIREIADERGVPDETPSAQRFANVGGTAQQDLAFLLDNHLIVTGEGLGDFAWTAVLVAPTDAYGLGGLEAHDIDHDGDDELFLTSTYTRRSIDLGGDVVQSFVTVFDLQNEELVPLLQQETGMTLPDGTQFGMDMILRERSDRTVVRFRRADGATMTRDTYIEVDPGTDDYEPALLPWSGPDMINWDRDARGNWVVLPPE